MLVTSGNLRTLGVGFNAAFQSGLGMAATDHLKIATRVPSSTAKEEYGWLGKMPSVREWIGDRVVQNMKTHDYTIKNKDYELTLGVDRNDIDDDNIGIYGPLFTEMGQSTGAFPCQLVYSLLKAGFNTNCYDGQFFFDTDHPVLDVNGVETGVANTDGGVGSPWFLIDTSRVLKPILLQVRKDWQFVPKDKLDDDNVFGKKEFLYGADARMNVGFGFWQFIWGSKQPLTPANYAAARKALMEMKGDYGRPLGIMPNLLVTAPALESDAKKIVNSEYGAGGVTNEWKGTAEHFVTPWLA